MSEMRRFMVRHQHYRESIQPYNLVLAANPVRAAELALAAYRKAGLNPAYVAVYEVHNDDNEGLKVAVNSAGDFLYEVKGDGVVLSEKSYADYFTPDEA